MGRQGRVLRFDIDEALICGGGEMLCEEEIIMRWEGSFS